MFYKKLLALIACFTLSATTYAPAKSSAARKASIAAAAIGGLSAASLSVYLYLLNSYLADAKTSTEKRAISNSIKRIHTLLGISSGAIAAGLVGTWATHNDASTTNNPDTPSSHSSRTKSTGTVRNNSLPGSSSPTNSNLTITPTIIEAPTVNNGTQPTFHPSQLPSPPSTPPIPPHSKQIELKEGLGTNLRTELTKPTTQIPIASPYSIYSALGMLLLSAQENSKEEQEILTALNASSRKEAINIINDPKKAYDKKVDLNIFNAAILTTERDQQCGEALRSQLGVETEQVNGRSREEITNHVNDLCKKHTKGMIPEIIDFVQPNSNILLNTLYLKAQWQTPFDEGNTRKAPFTSHDGAQTDVQMMYENNLSLRCSEDEAGNIYAAIPYKYEYQGKWENANRDDQLHLCIYLPADASNLGNANFNTIFNLKYQDANLHFPRCSITTPATDITSIIEAMGISETTLNALEFDTVMHAAVMEFNEEGVKAAAATTEVLCMMCAPNCKPRKPPIEVNVNKPFAFSLRNKYTEFFTGIITSADDLKKLAS